MNNNPRFLLFTAYGAQQFGNSPFTYALGIEKKCRKQFFQVSKTPFKVLQPPNGLKRRLVSGTLSKPLTHTHALAHIVILKYIRNQSLGK